MPQMMNLPKNLVEAAGLDEYFHSRTGFNLRDPEVPDRHRKSNSPRMSGDTVCEIVCFKRLEEGVCERV